MIEQKKLTEQRGGGAAAGIINQNIFLGAEREEREARAGLLDLRTVKINYEYF